MASLSIDDLSRRKGRSNRWAIVSSRDEQGHVHVLGVLENYTKEAVKVFFEHSETVKKPNDWSGYLHISHN